jgi:hypothetical protein
MKNSFDVCYLYDVGEELPAWSGKSCQIAANHNTTPPGLTPHHQQSQLSTVLNASITINAMHSPVPTNQAAPKPPTIPVGPGAPPVNNSTTANRRWADVVKAGVGQSTGQGRPV